jgi:hypothetical protein
MAMVLPVYSKHSVTSLSRQGRRNKILLGLPTAEKCQREKDNKNAKIE